MSFESSKLTQGRKHRLSLLICDHPPTPWQRITENSTILSFTIVSFISSAHVLKLHPTPTSAIWGIVQASSSWIPQPSEPRGLPLNWGRGETQVRKEKCWACSSLSYYTTLVSTSWETNSLFFLCLGLPLLPTASVHSSAWENWVNLDRKLCLTYLNPRFMLTNHQEWLLKT